jgi:hypothetical protein
MSGGFTLVIKLPPEETLLRDFAITSLAYVKEYGDVENVQVEFLLDKIRVSAQSQEAVLDIFRALYQDAANIADNKVKKIHLGILQNDQRILSELLRRREVEGFTYLDVVRDFLNAYALSDIDLLSLGQVKMNARGIRLGKGNFAAVNWLTSERYEYGMEFWRLNYRRRLQIRLDETWYALILAGFALSVSSFIGNDLIIVYLPEDFIYSVKSPSKIFEALEALGKLRGYHRKLSEIIYEEWCPPEPFSAFTLLISLNLVMRAEDVSALYLLNYSLPLALCRLRRTKNVFTMIEKRRTELFDTLKFATKLIMMENGKELVEELANIAKRTLHLGGDIAKKRKNEADFTVYNRFCTLLLQAIQGAYSPYEIVYYGTRYHIIRDTDLAEGIIHALT